MQRDGRTTRRCAAHRAPVRGSSGTNRTEGTVPDRVGIRNGMGNIETERPGERKPFGRGGTEERNEKRNGWNRTERGGKLSSGSGRNGAAGGRTEGRNGRNGGVGKHRDRRKAPLRVGTRRSGRRSFTAHGAQRDGNGNGNGNGTNGPGLGSEPPRRSRCAPFVGRSFPRLSRRDSRTAFRRRPRRNEMRGGDFGEGVEPLPAE